MGVYSFNEFKTITCGDGGMVVTDDEHLYRRAFAMHDQGHSPGREGVEIGARPFLGLNFRMTELEGAVLLAQVRRVAAIREHLSANAALVRSIIEEVPAIEFRELPDPDGDLATHLVVIFPSRGWPSASRPSSGRSRSTAPAGMSTRTWSTSWSAARRPGGAIRSTRRATRRPEYRVGMLPATDALLARSMSFSIGVHDPNLAPFGAHARRRHGRCRASRALPEVALRHLD